MSYKQGRYSYLIKPLFLLIDLLIINGLVFLFQININNIYIFTIYITLQWLLISFIIRFYEVTRYFKIVQVVTLIFNQIVFYTLILYAFIGFFKQPNISRLALVYYIISVFILVLLLKFLGYYLLRKYRASLGRNNRNVIVIGNTEKAKKLIHIFKTRSDFGYLIKKQFNIKTQHDLDQCLSFIIENDIDEIYTSIQDVSNEIINELIDFADNNLRKLKFIPDNKDIYTKKLKYEYYDYIPILSLRSMPLQDKPNMYLKRGFDIIIALFVIVFILSWLTPLMAILIKLETKGPVFFKQARNGFNNIEFYCYKYRSMVPNKKAHLQQAQKNDQRVTKTGKFIRRTSIDELPQFYNVLTGDMSVVGPRPHMVSHTHMYAQRIDKFMLRHFVKPGITGLAQVSGFRGEVENKRDIINRVKYDIFYVENWSLLLDIKILIQTIINSLKGEKKAY